MDLGQRLKQARLEAGLSQRQLCGDIITRNMLSQIENGSARPSMDTLRYLAGRLGKPMGYFLEEQPLSPNQAIMLRARSAAPEEALALLEDYQAPDPVFDPERYLLEALCCMHLAQAALKEHRAGYAAALLEQAAEAGSRTAYYTQDLERRRLLLCHAAGTLPALDLAALLPDNTPEILLRAEAVLESGNPERCAALLETAGIKDARWHELRADVYFAAGDFQNAADHYRQAGDMPRIYARLEQCYREMEDYKLAYFYACKQR